MGHCVCYILSPSDFHHRITVFMFGKKVIDNCHHCTLFVPDRIWSIHFIIHKLDKASCSQILLTVNIIKISRETDNKIVKYPL